MLRADAISLRLGGRLVLDAVSAAIPCGRLTLLLGANGAGKSSLLRCLSGALKPERGAVSWDGKLLAEYPLLTLARRRAVLAQAPAIAFPFSALEIVLLGRSPHQLAGLESSGDIAIAMAALKAMQAQDLAARLWPTLSGGEQQRVQLARVLAQIWQTSKAALLLDEPAAALDLKHQHHLFGFLRRLARQQQLALCVITHDLHLARHYADDVILLREGRVFAAGEAESVLTQDAIIDVFDIGSLLPAAHAIGGRAYWPLAQKSVQKSGQKSVQEQK